MGTMLPLGASGDSLTFLPKESRRRENSGSNGKNLLKEITSVAHNDFFSFALKKAEVWPHTSLYLVDQVKTCLSCSAARQASRRG